MIICHTLIERVSVPQTSQMFHSCSPGLLHILLPLPGTLFHQTPATITWIIPVHPSGLSSDITSRKASWIFHPAFSAWYPSSPVPRSCHHSAPSSNVASSNRPPSLLIYHLFLQHQDFGTSRIQCLRQVDTQTSKLRNDCASIVHCTLQDMAFRAYIISLTYITYQTVNFLITRIMSIFCTIESSVPAIQSGLGKYLLKNEHM